MTLVNIASAPAKKTSTLSSLSRNSAYVRARAFDDFRLRIRSILQTTFRAFRGALTAQPTTALPQVGEHAPSRAALEDLRVREIRWPSATRAGRLKRWARSPLAV